MSAIAFALARGRLASMKVMPSLDQIHEEGFNIRLQVCQWIKQHVPQGSQEAMRMKENWDLISYVPQGPNLQSWASIDHFVRDMQDEYRYASAQSKPSQEMPESINLNKRIVS